MRVEQALRALERAEILEEHMHAFLREARPDTQAMIFRVARFYTEDRDSMWPQPVRRVRTGRQQTWTKVRNLHDRTIVSAAQGMRRVLRGTRTGDARAVSYCNRLFDLTNVPLDHWIKIFELEASVRGLDITAAAASL